VSFLWWQQNDNRDAILSTYPEWEFSGFVLYDGYGNFAEHLYRAMVEPGTESWQRLRGFSATYIHTLRPVFPACIALMNLLFHNILVSAIVVNLLASLGFVYAFNLLLTRHFEFQEDSLFHLNVLAITHVGVVGMLARPMADALSMCLLLLVFHAALLVREQRNWRHIAALALLVLLCVAAKTVTVLVLAALPVALIAFKGLTRQQAWGRVALTAGAGSVGLAAFLWVLHTFFLENEAVAFLFEVLKGPFVAPPSGDYLKVYARAGVLFLALALQAYPLFWPGNRRMLEPRYRLLLAWLAVYILQRFLFSGFNLDYSRARYGIPLVPAALIVAWPGVERWLGARAGWFAWGMVAANGAVWVAAFLKET
jgi:hypothetical protein